MEKRGGFKKRVFFDWRYVPTERRRLYNWSLVLFGSIAMFLFFQHFVISRGIVTERSMWPTLREGDAYLVNRYLYRFTPPQRGEIVVLRRHWLDTEEYVKRVIGLPGETLRIEGGAVYINGQRLEEPYAIGSTRPDLGPIRIEKDRYFVMGDNRPESEDSRHFGPVHLKAIEGKIKPGEWFPLR